MSVYYPGGIISASERIPNKASANGVWYLPTVAQYTSAGVWPNITLLSDNVFSYNTLLIHADGTNGANNTVFLDSSYALTSFSGTYSDSFNGSSQYLSASGSTFTIGTGNFTIEAWVYNNGAGATTATLLSNAANSGSTDWFRVKCDPTGFTTFSTNIGIL